MHYGSELRTELGKFPSITGVKSQLVDLSTISQACVTDNSGKSEGNYLLFMIKCPCYVGPCHHSMARYQDVDREHGLHIWKIAANILNNQSRTADIEWSHRLGVTRGANNTVKNNLLRNVTQDFGTGQIFFKRCRQRKIDMIFGTWNFKNLYRAGSLITVASELTRSMIDIATVEEARGLKV
jgi:hypothetical protein